jgi:hypothetical protein
MRMTGQSADVVRIWNGCTGFFLCCFFFCFYFFRALRDFFDTKAYC